MLHRRRELTPRQPVIERSAVFVGEETGRAGDPLAANAIPRRRRRVVLAVRNLRFRPSHPVPPKEGGSW